MRPPLLVPGLDRRFAEAAEQLAKFKRDGVAIVLVTGSLDFMMQPLAKEFGAVCIAPRLIERDGMFTGELDRPALTVTPSTSK